MELDLCLDRNEREDLSPFSVLFCPHSLLYCAFSSCAIYAAFADAVWKRVKTKKQKICSCSFSNVLHVCV